MFQGSIGLEGMATTSVVVVFGFPFHSPHLLAATNDNFIMQGLALESNAIFSTTTQPHFVKDCVTNGFAAICVDAVDTSIGSHQKAWVTELALTNFQIPNEHPSLTFIRRISNAQGCSFVNAIVKCQN